jgi:hypothetical protein
MLFLNHPLVRAHYLKHGRVFTLRAQLRKRNGPQPLVHGSRFRHRPLGRGLVTFRRELKSLNPRALAPYVRHSGFPKGAAWIEAYLRFNQGKLILPVYLYEVRKLNPAKSEKRL